MEELNTKCRKKLRLSTEIFAVYLENDTSRPIVIVDTNDSFIRFFNENTVITQWFNNMQCIKHVITNKCFTLVINVLH